MVRVAITGLGRIGRTAFRIAHQTPGIEVVAINDLASPMLLGHLLRYDTNYGRFDAVDEVAGDGIVVDGRPIRVYDYRDPLEIPWNDGVDVVIESTGRFAGPIAKSHLSAGASGVVISAPAGEETPTFVIGVNEHEMKPTDKVISNASCTTNCLAPVAKTMDADIGIVSGFMTTIHAYTSDQMVQDGPHRDLRRARTAAANLIPTTTGAAEAIGLVLPELAGKLKGIAVRAPVATGSMIDLMFLASTSVSAGEVNNELQGASEHDYPDGILGFTEDPLVSSDVIGDSHSAIVDGKLTDVVNGNLVKVVAWYDNEYGYASRLVEQAINLGRVIGT